MSRRPWSRFIALAALLVAGCSGTPRNCSTHSCATDYWGGSAADLTTAIIAFRDTLPVADRHGWACHSLPGSVYTKLVALKVSLTNALPPELIPPGFTAPWSDGAHNAPAAIGDLADVVSNQLEADRTSGCHMNPGSPGWLGRVPVPPNPDLPTAQALLALIGEAVDM